MKKIGILGGTSWPSTMSYYEELQKKYGQTKGEAYSAEIVLYSINYHPIKSLYSQADGWQKIPDLLLAELETLFSMPIGGFIIANNTLHRAYDILVQENKIQSRLPIFHALELTAKKAKQLNYNKVLLLGTPATMEHEFFKNYFYKENIEIIIPEADDRKTIGAIQSKAALGEITPEGNAKFLGIVEQYASKADGIVLGCTELPLMMPARHEFKVLNPVELQCEKAVEFLLG